LLLRPAPSPPHNMRLALSLVLAAVAATPTVALQAPAFVLPSRAGASRAQYSPRRVAVRMEEAAPTSYEEYLQKRIDAGEDIESAYSDLGQDIDFDGGDSGSGAVGDGKMTLDDQHNSPFIVGSGSASDGALGTQNAATAGDPFAGRGVKAAVNARDAKQKNYWGRQVGTGYADALEDDARYASRPVLRQQLENWQNQQQLKRATDGQVESQSTFYGVVQEDPSRYRKDMGRPIDSMRSEIRAPPAQPGLCLSSSPLCVGQATPHATLPRPPAM